MSKEQKNAYSRAYYQRNREALIAKQRARTQEKLAANPDHFAEYRKAYWDQNRERLLEHQRVKGRERYKAKKPQYQERNRKARFKNYGLDQHEYQDILDAQGGGCAICTASPRVRTMAIDHDHQTGKVRGILCRQCNTALGLLGDNPERIMEAADYLTRSLSGATSTTNSGQSSDTSTPLASATRH